MDRTMPVRMILAPDASTAAITPRALISQIIVKTYQGSRGMMTRSMVIRMMRSNSSKPLRRACASVKMMPTPIRKDSSKAVRTSQTGGILRSK